MDPEFSCDLFIVLDSSSCARVNRDCELTENELLALAARGKCQLCRTPLEICRLKDRRPHLASSVGISGNCLNWTCVRQFHPPWTCQLSGGSSRQVSKKPPQGVPWGLCLGDIATSTYTRIPW
ncbi:unnamed protein product [Sphagnum troendelagicum]|uniref:Uncharacterized protein n=1 Tax=Sphagnum troendelagicum TaxID=128251 RepID=A0ABP0UZX9_9BRYO